MSFWTPLAHFFSSSMIWRHLLGPSKKCYSTYWNNLDWDISYNNFESDIHHSIKLICYWIHLHLTWYVCGCIALCCWMKLRIWNWGFIFEHSHNFKIWKCECYLVNRRIWIQMLNYNHISFNRWMRWSYCCYHLHSKPQI